jgi:hypothetical protein
MIRKACYRKNTFAYVLYCNCVTQKKGAMNAPKRGKTGFTSYLPLQPAMHCSKLLWQVPLRPQV